MFRLMGIRFFFKKLKRTLGLAFTSLPGVREKPFLKMKIDLTNFY